MSAPTPAASLPHGLAAKEMLELTKAGLSRTEALSAGTWGAARATSTRTTTRAASRPSTCPSALRGKRYYRPSGKGEESDSG